MNMSIERDQDLKIVVVDDSDFSRRNIIEILEAENFNIVGQAKSAEEAMPLTATTGANLFIIDIVMPEISGLELAEKITELAKKKKFIVMISSLKLQSLIIESISSGASDVLEKPFSPGDLINTVEKIEIALQEEK